MVTVRPKSVDFRGMRLSPEEGFVLSRVDGPLTMKELIVLTGLEEARVLQIVAHLAAEGALEVEGTEEAAAPPEPLPELEEIGPVDPSELGGDELEEIGPVEGDLEEIGPVDPA